MAEQTLKIKVIFDTSGSNEPLGRANKNVKLMAGSVGILERQIKKAQLAQRQLTVGTDEHARATSRLMNLTKLLEQTQMKANAVTFQNTKQLASMGTTLQALNYTIRDSPYFFQNFALGVLAVGNNLNPMIDGIIRSNQEAKAMGTTLTKSLLSALTGPQGLVFGFSVLVSVMQAAIFAMSGTKSKAKALTTDLESLGDAGALLSDKFREVADSMESADFDNFDSIMSGLEARMRALNKEADSEANAFERVALSVGGLNKVLLSLFSDFDKFADSLEKLKILEETRNRLHALTLEFVTLIQAFKDGDLESQLSFLTGSEASTFLSNLEKMREEFSLTGNEAKTFTILGQSITLTKDEIDKLIKSIEKLTKPAKEKTEIELLREQLQELLDKRVLAQTAQEFRTIEDALHGVLTRLNQLQNRFVITGDELEALPPGLVTTDVNTISMKDKAQLSQTPLDPQFMQELTQRYEGWNRQLLRVEESFTELDGLATRLGNSLFQAFIQGKFAADQLVKSLIAVAAQMAIIEGLKFVFSGGTSGLFAKATADTGISATASAVKSVATTSPNVQNNQTIIVEPVFKGLIEGQTIIQEGVRQQTSVLR